MALRCLNENDIRAAEKSMDTEEEESVESEDLEDDLSQHGQDEYQSASSMSHRARACKVAPLSEQDNTLKKATVEDDKALAAKKYAKVAGGRIYGAFCVVYAIAMAASFADLIPVAPFELQTVKDTVNTSEFLAKYMWVPFVLAAVYYFTVFGIQDYLKDRKPFDLRYALAAWSMLLAAFSMMGSLRTVPALVNVIQTRGLAHMLCGDTRFDWLVGNPAGWWTTIFIYSKLPELIDTLFIVLRKKKLITLHWYHHITVMIFCWHSMATMCMNGLIFSAMNLTVHSFMYAFYAVTALGYRPSQFAIYITLIQIAQMVVGTAVTVYVNYQERVVESSQEYMSILKAPWDITTQSEINDGTCKVHPVNANAGLAMYASYLYLFCSFFYYAYLKSNKGKTA